MIRVPGFVGPAEAFRIIHWFKNTQGKDMQKTRMHSYMVHVNPSSSSCPLSRRCWYPSQRLMILCFSIPSFKEKHRTGRNSESEDVFSARLKSLPTSTIWSVITHADFCDFTSGSPVGLVVMFRASHSGVATLPVLLLKTMNRVELSRPETNSRAFTVLLLLKVGSFSCNSPRVSFALA